MSGNRIASTIDNSTLEIVSSLGLMSTTSMSSPPWLVSASTISLEERSTLIEIKSNENENENVNYRQYNIQNIK